MGLGFPPVAHAHARGASSVNWSNWWAGLGGIECLVW